MLAVRMNSRVRLVLTAVAFEKNRMNERITKHDSPLKFHLPKKTVAFCYVEVDDKIYDVAFTSNHVDGLADSNPYLDIKNNFKDFYPELV